MADHYVSPSALGDFRKCRRCFWLDRTQKIKRPRGAFPTLPGGIDRVLKAYFDQHRAKGTLPPELRGKVGIGDALFRDMVKLTEMRNARKPMLTTIIGNVKLVGGIDDLLVGPSSTGGRVSPFDVKTKGRAIEDETDPFEWYRGQLNDYGLLLQAGGFTLSGKGYLGYWSPDEIAPIQRDQPGNETVVRMRCQVFSMDLDLDAARVEVIEAGQCLDGELPEADPGCETCAYVAAYALAVAQ